MTHARRARNYVLGLSIGTFWLIAASTGFSLSLLAPVGTSGATASFFSIAGAALMLLALSLRQVIKAARLPRSMARPSTRSPVGRRFLWIVILEVAAIIVVNVIAFRAGHLSLMVPLDLIIVGLHFFPLATLFAVPRYHGLGAAFCIVSVLTLVLVPADAHLGATFARFVVASLGCALAAWLTAIGNMFELRRLLSTSAGSPSAL